MVFDFSQSLSGTIYVDGELVTGTAYTLQLESMYNNEGLNNLSTPITLTRLTGTSRYSIFTYTLDPVTYPDFTTKDINGYYKAKFYADDILAAEYPAKVKNQFNDNYYTQYDSDNEDNEQYVYYR